MLVEMIPQFFMNAGAHIKPPLLAIAGKIVSHNEKIVLKLSAACFESLRLAEILERCRYAPAIT
jgi:hypothetical protein